MRCRNWWEPGKKEFPGLPAAKSIDWNRRVELKMIRVTIAIYAICLLPIGVVAQTSDSAESLTSNPVYQRNCAKCHGKTAEGRHFGGPSLASSNAAAASSDDLRTIISNGKGHMPKFAGKLAPEEVDQLVAQIKALAKK